MTFDSNREAELLAKASRIFPGSNTGNPILGAERVLVLTKGKGPRVWDAAGNEYIDYLMGSGPLVLGHSHPSVVEAVVEAVEGGSTFFAVNEKAILLAGGNRQRRSVRRPGPVHYQRHRRLLPGHADSTGAPPTGQDTQV